MSVKDLVMRYDEQVVLNGIDFEVRPGEVVVILGGSGSGKSTLLRAMLSLHPPVRGSVNVLGVDMVNAPDQDLEALISVDVQGWVNELPQVREHLARFGGKLPAEIENEMSALEERLKPAV